MFDVIIDCEHIGVGIYRMKPDGGTLEYQQDYIRDCTGAQARRNGQMHTPADSRFFPFSFESVHRDRRDVAVRIAATTSLAHEKMPLDDANGLLLAIASGDIDKNVGRHEVYSTRALILWRSPPTIRPVAKSPAVTEASQYDFDAITAPARSRTEEFVRKTSGFRMDWLNAFGRKMTSRDSAKRKFVLKAVRKIIGGSHG
jgi:hypothetical protein